MIPAKDATKTSAKKSRLRPLKTLWVAAGLCLGLSPAVSAVRAADTASKSTVERGEYLFHAAGCASCHTDRDNEGTFLAGGRAFETAFGTFYSPNITPHPEHGIGDWSDEDFVRAMHEGARPDGGHYFPVFPYTAYTRIRREDVLAVKAYLDTVEPSSQPNREHDLPWYLPRLAASAWQLLFADTGRFAPDPERSEAWNRGAYLAEALAHCSECHTPRDRFGRLQQDLAYAGNPQGPEGGSVPNITPHKETGIGAWGKSDLKWYFETGGDPDGDYAGGLMAEVIDHGLSKLSGNDRDALAQYLLSLPAIDHKVKKSKRERR